MKKDTRRTPSGKLIVYEGLLHHELKTHCQKHGIWHYKTEVCPLCDKGKR